MEAVCIHALSNAFCQLLLKSASRFLNYLETSMYAGVLNVLFKEGRYLLSMQVATDYSSPYLIQHKTFV